MRNYLILAGVIGFVLGIAAQSYAHKDTGKICLEMYENPEELSECLWILNYKE